MAFPEPSSSSPFGSNTRLTHSIMSPTERKLTDSRASSPSSQMILFTSLKITISARLNR